MVPSKKETDNEVLKEKQTITRTHQTMRNQQILNPYVKSD